MQEDFIWRVDIDYKDSDGEILSDSITVYAVTRSDAGHIALRQLARYLPNTSTPAWVTQIDCLGRDKRFREGWQ
jgi:hypothetical protein